MQHAKDHFMRFQLLYTTDFCFFWGKSRQVNTNKDTFAIFLESMYLILCISNIYTLFCICTQK